MNTFISSKLGEVLAFARVGKDTVQTGREGFLKFISDNELEDISEKCESLENSISAFATKNNVTDDVEEAAEEAEEKITDMRDEYIDGEWDAPDEVLEWMGFYTGAALVHWHLIMGAAESMGNEGLRTLAADAVDFYSGLFVQDEDILHSIGERAVSEEDEETDDEDLGE
jgi:hypothetical protein